ncbi:TPA: EAL domain-containing protein, partial [Serratia liquefaciens]
IITLAQRLKLKLVAEGVETAEQVEYLRSHDVNALQGFYFAKPMPIHVFPLWLQQYESRLRTGNQREEQKAGLEKKPEA